MDQIEILQTMINESNNIVFFGGAGVSTESGIKDFRSADGLYSQSYKYPPEYMLSYTCFKRHTEDFFQFYREKILFKGILPNKAHLKLAEMEYKSKLKGVVTQNIDGLHHVAGSKIVYELHGSIERNNCVSCGEKYGKGIFDETTGIPKCKICGGIIKPDVVLYEEPLEDTVVNLSIRAIANSDMLIVAGTSLTVYPASSLINYFKGKKLVIINKGETQMDTRAKLVIRERVGEVLGAISA